MHLTVFLHFYLHFLFNLHEICSSILNHHVNLLTCGLFNVFPLQVGGYANTVRSPEAEANNVRDFYKV